MFCLCLSDGRYMEDGNQKYSFLLENAEFINGAMNLVGVSSKGNQSAVMVLNVGSRQWIKLSYLMKVGLLSLICSLKLF